MAISLPHILVFVKNYFSQKPNFANRIDPARYFRYSEPLVRAVSGAEPPAVRRSGCGVHFRRTPGMDFPACGL
jgi:hypothetical protein